MPLPLAIPLIAAAIPSIAKIGQGIGQTSKGNKLAKQNIRPTYEIPKEFQQNLAIAENMAKIGLPQQEYNRAQQNFQRNQASALRQFGRMGNPRGLAGIVRAGNDATLGLDVADAQARLSNQRNAMGFRSQIGNQQLAKQQWDKFQKFGEQADAAAALQGAGRQNTMGGLTELSQLGQMAMLNGGKMSPSGQGQMATGVSQGQIPFNSAQYLSQFGMPNPQTTQPMSGFPFSGFGGMSNYNKISGMGRPQMSNYFRGVPYKLPY